ncbi:MAG: DinB family protein [Candidatus Heimdallarchaeaceae archaeon]
MKPIDSLIKELKIADMNFLMSIKNIDASIVVKQIQKDVNHIAWIVGHCVVHMDHYLSYHTGEKLFSSEERDYYAYGVSKDHIVDYPFSFQKLLDGYLEISSKYFQILEKLPFEEFNKKPDDASEKLSDLIHRISLHIMGHTGQIVLLRRMFENPYWAFVGGVSETQRDELRQGWLDWWIENKKEFS